MKDLQAILQEDDSRLAAIAAPLDPVTGEGSIGERVRVVVKDMPGTPVMWLPVEMMDNELVKQLLAAKTVKNYIRRNRWEYTDENIDLVVEAFIRVRITFDFPFWAALYAVIQDKVSGRLVKFILNRPQRLLISMFEDMRKAGMPIRLVLLKARQWGGSTATQIYMAWLQLVLTYGHNSAIVAHQKKASYGVRNMLKRLIEHYPVRLVHEMGDEYKPGEPIITGTPSPNVISIKARECEVEVGSAENPDSERSANTYLVHLTEVAFWKSTENKEPGDIVRSVCSGVLLQPLTLIVYESTANGTGNFFQEEYDAAKNGESNFRALFIAWWQIEMYSLPFKDEDERADFAIWLYKNRNNANVPDNRHEPGKYLWRLFTLGATLEAIHWYVVKRSEYHSHAGMAAEFPSDDIEAFVNSGKRIFDIYLVDKFKEACRPPLAVGDVTGRGLKGADALLDLKFSEDNQGLLWVWQYPETYPDERVMYRYLVTVDIGGRSDDADWSVISVLDRYDMMEGGLPSIVAQWYGHIDHDRLAWKAAQIAAWYDNALLVIESNTLETKDKNRYVDGDQSSFILNELKEVYPNLYARKSSGTDSVSEGAEVKYGFHTNVKTKGDIISLLIEIIRDHLYIERDKRCLDEYLTYEEHDGSFDAIEGKHDDLLMTRAIGLWICYKEMPRPYFVKIGSQSYTAAATMP